MKKTILVLAILAAISPWAQSAPNQPPAGQSVSASSGNPNLPWWFANPPSASQSGANLAASDLGARLANLQSDLQQVLPVLTSVNANLQSANPKASAQPAETTSEEANAPTPPLAPTGVNYGVNNGQNTSSSAGVNVGQNSTASVGYTPPAPAASSGFSVVVPPTAPAPPNPLTAPQVPAATGANEVVSPDSTSEAVRQLLTLQADIQRMLPVVASLNSGGLNLASGLVPQSVPNRLYTTPTGSSQPQILTPTGR